MATAQRKKSLFQEIYFPNSDFRNGTRKVLISYPTIYTEIQPFKVECFSTKMLEFHYDDVIIYDIRGDLGILFGMRNRLLMSSLVQNFTVIQPMMTEIRGGGGGALCIFRQNERGFSTMTSLHF